MDVLEEIKDKEKAVLIIDLSGCAVTFFKYKGNIINLSEMSIKEKLNQMEIG